MSITISIDEPLLRAAQAALNVHDPAELVRRLLEQTVRQHEAEARLIALGGTMPNLELLPRDRSPFSHQ